MTALSTQPQVMTLRGGNNSTLFATADAQDSVRLYEFTPGLHRMFRVCFLPATLPPGMRSMSQAFLGQNDHVVIRQSA